MTLRRYFLSALSLAATGTAAWAQSAAGMNSPASAGPGTGQAATGAAAIGQTERPVATDDGLNLRFADGLLVGIPAVGGVLVGAWLARRIAHRTLALIFAAVLVAAAIELMLE